MYRMFSLVVLSVSGFLILISYSFSLRMTQVGALPGAALTVVKDRQVCAEDRGQIAWFFLHSPL